MLYMYLKFKSVIIHLDTIKFVLLICNLERLTL